MKTANLQKAVAQLSNIAVISSIFRIAFHQLQGIYFKKPVDPLIYCQEKYGNIKSSKLKLGSIFGVRNMAVNSRRDCSRFIFKFNN